MFTRPTPYRADRAPTDSRRWQLALSVIAGAVIALSVAYIAATLPSAHPGAAASAPSSSPLAGGHEVRGTVTAVHVLQCPGTSEDRLPDGTVPASVTCVESRVRLSTNQTATVYAPPSAVQEGLRKGTAVVLTRYPGAAGQPSFYTWEDFDRRLPLGAVVAGFCLLTILVGLRRGFGALLGLFISIVAVVCYLVPALATQHNATLVALSTACAVMGLVLYLTHGFSLRTTTAYLGTIGGLAATALLAHLAITANHLSGMSGENSNTVRLMIGSPDLRAVVLAGTLVAALGLLNDVTITQAAAVWEIRSANPSLAFTELFRSGMRVGRDHLASTVYTVVFAYAGTTLPTLLLLRLSATSTAQMINGSLIGEAIVSACVGGIGLALTVPLTTALAAAITAMTSTEPSLVPLYTERLRPGLASATRSRPPLAGHRRAKPGGAPKAVHPKVLAKN